MEKLKDFLKPSWRKFGIFSILFIFLLIVFVVNIRSEYAIYGENNPNAIYLSTFLFGPFAHIKANMMTEIILKDILGIVWMYLISCLINFLYFYNKKTLIVVGVILISFTIISFDMFSIPGKLSKTMFIEALQKNDTSYCQKIPKIAKIKADEIDNLRNEVGYPIKWIGFLPGKYPMRDTCIRVIKDTTGMEAYTKAVDSGVTDMEILESLFPTY